MKAQQTRSTRRRSRGLLLAPLLALSPAGGCQAPEREPATISFHRILADDRIRSMLGDDTLVSEVQAWHGGITASYRPARARPLPDMLAEARAQFSDGFRRALAANSTRLRAFAAVHGPAALEHDPAVREELTSLLNLRDALTAGLAASTSAAPLLYALEAEGHRRVSPETGRAHQGRALKPAAYAAFDLQQRAPTRDLATLGRTLAALAAEPEAVDRSRPAKLLRSHAPTPIVPAWWPQEGDLYYDGDRFLDSTMKWPTINLEPADQQAGYEHSVMLARGFLEGCTTMTSLEDGYAECARGTWEHDPDFDVHRVGTRSLSGLRVGRRYWGMWAFTGTDASRPLSENRLEGRQTRPAPGCAMPPCFTTTKRVWYLTRGLWELTRSQVTFARWAPDLVWQLKDGIPNED